MNPLIVVLIIWFFIIFEIDISSWRIVQKLNLGKYIRNPFKTWYCWNRKEHKQWYRIGNIKGCTYCGWHTARYKRTEVI